jgi:hypothetical protein
MRLAFNLQRGLPIDPGPIHWFPVIRFCISIPHILNIYGEILVLLTSKRESSKEIWHSIRIGYNIVSYMYLKFGHSRLTLPETYHVLRL